jgi:hypothetical protein
MFADQFSSFTSIAGNDKDVAAGHFQVFANIQM